MLEYLDFDLEIGEGEGRDYSLAVLRSPAGEAQAVFLEYLTRLSRRFSNPPGLYWLHLGFRVCVLPG